MYPHIVMQVNSCIRSNLETGNGYRAHAVMPSMKFETDDAIESNLALSKQLLATKYKDRLESSYKVC